MIKEVIKPMNNKVVLPIPVKYIKKSLEITIRPVSHIKTAKGILKQYANPKKMKAEKKVWDLAIEEKYGHR